MSPSPRPIRFFHRGAVVTVSGVHPTRSVLDWLREDARCVGTKEGCNEGDCGACTVVVGTLVADTAAGIATDGPGRDADPIGAVRGLRLEAVNACLRFLPALDGRALFTVEDLKTIARPAPLHPVQQALVDAHGSQCGFCTPGFVMTLWSVYEHHMAAGTRPGRQELADALSGNLCRCTGYRPILDAGERMFDLPPALLDTAPAVAALRTLRRKSGDGNDAGAIATFEYAAPNPAVSDAAGAPRIDRWFAPRTVEALAELCLEHPQARLVAGATDVGLWVTKQFRDLGDIIHLGDCEPLAAVRDEAGREGNDADSDSDSKRGGTGGAGNAGTAGDLWIGAAAPLEAAWRALARRHPGVAEIGLRFGSPAVRNAGTLGGNIANGSPIGDAAPVLLVLDGLLELRRGERVRLLALSDFFTGYMTNRLEPGEFLQAIRIPPAPARSALKVRAWKISKRFDCDISAVCAAFALALDEQTGGVRHVRIAFGGMAAVVKRATAAEAALAGRRWDDEATLRAAQAALERDYAPLTDLRASAAYRMQAAQNLLERFWLETRGEGALPPEALGVWSERRAALAV